MMDLAGYRQLGDLEVEGKCVFVRADFGVVPPTDEGQWFDDGTVSAIVPTVTLLTTRGARVVLGSGVRTASGATPSLEPVASLLAEQLGAEVYLPDDCVGDARKLVLGNLRAGQVCLLENVARHPEEAAGDMGFAEQLGKGTDLYVSDALASLFERTTSNVELARWARGRAVGEYLRMQLDVAARIRASGGKGLVVVVTADTAAQAEPWMRALSGRAERLFVAGLFGETLKRARASVGRDGDLAAARTLADRIDASDTQLAPLSTSPDTGELAEDSLEQLTVAFKPASMALWVDCQARSVRDELGAGPLALASALAQLAGFTGVIGDELGVVLRRQCPQVLAQMNFLPTGSASLLKLVEGRRSVALESLGAPS